MDRPNLILRFVRKRMEGNACPVCGGEYLVDYHLGRGYQVALEGHPAPVCDECVEYHAPELIAARGAADALKNHLEDKRRELEQQRGSEPFEVPF